MPFIAKTMAGLEPVLSKELEAIGAEDIKSLTRAVSFTGDTALLYKANYTLRTALRIFAPIHQFKASNEKELYKAAYAFDWKPYLDPKRTFAIDAVVNSELHTHSKYAALKVKDALVDQFRDKYGRRPSVDVKNPDLRIHLHIAQDQCSILLDSSGDSLHKRKYRFEKVQAPINEVLAAGMILLSGWQGEKPLIDPMCGSGTFLVEAAMIARNIPPQKGRKRFGFMNWVDFDPELWDKVKEEAHAKEKTLDVPIIGSDISANAVQIARKNIAMAKMTDDIEVRQQDFFSSVGVFESAMLIMNPPYDERMPVEDIALFYKQIGDHFKQAYPGYEAWLISSQIEAIKRVGLKPSRRFHLFNGPLECKFFRYDLYAGTKKHATQDD